MEDPRKGRLPGVRRIRLSAMGCPNKNGGRIPMQVIKLWFVMEPRKTIGGGNTDSKKPILTDLHGERM